MKRVVYSLCLILNGAFFSHVYSEKTILKNPPVQGFQFKDPTAVDFKKFEDSFSIPVSPEVKRYYTDAEKIDGWFDRRLMFILLLTDSVQKKNNVTGNLCEIGVWHGKSFIPLMYLAQPDENVLAVDCFDQYEFNRDNSGGGPCPLKKFNNNVSKYCSNLVSLKIKKGDFLKFTPSEYLTAVENSKKFRIISIDGCHEADTTFIDMDNASNCLVDGGVIVIDDYFHWCWPGVSEGVNAFMNKNQNVLKPFLIAWNKIFFTHAHHRQKYFDAFKELFDAKDMLIKKFFDVETVICDPH